jgi:hypothetical protein
MTTFTTEDRILAEKDGSLTFNVEPIPFAGLVTITEGVPTYKDLTDEEIDDLIDSVIPFILLGGRIFYQNFAKAILKKAQEK